MEQSKETQQGGKQRFFTSKRVFYLLFSLFSSLFLFLLLQKKERCVAENASDILRFVKEDEETEKEKTAKGRAEKPRNASIRRCLLRLRPLFSGSQLWPMCNFARG